MPASIATSLYTAAQVRAIDRAAIDELGIPGIVLMERAARAAWASLRARWPEASRILLLIGRGNNGGDAYLLGELALREGVAVQAWTLGNPATADAQQARRRFLDAGGACADAVAPTPVPEVDVIVDGMFGTGLARPIQGVAADWIGRARRSGVPVLALDVPSGLDADCGMPLGPVLIADATITFVALKRGLFTADGPDCCGRVELAPLDIPDAAYRRLAADAVLLADDALTTLPPRARNVNKGSFGRVLVLGGGTGMGGAVRLAGEAALRCGAGLVAVATHPANVAALHAGRPELIAHAIENVAQLVPLLDSATVLAIGPGLGRTEWARALFDHAVVSALPMVIDADALNLLAEAPRALSPGRVLTPHPGEAARLLGCTVADIQHDRFAAVRTMAKRFSASVVLKGAGSLIADPDGSVAVCPWGNPGMASAGMGDVLTGVIAALLAQEMPAFDAACRGVALHARAGDVAAGDAPAGLIASDLFVPLRRLVNGHPA